MNQSLLKLQIGPVQEFIAQARSTRDLWSGSYLLSWLMAAGISRLVQEVAALLKKRPSDSLDTVVYPDLSEQPLVARRLKVDVGETITDGADNDAVLTPNLPNLLVAKISAETAKVSTIARAVEAAMRNEWKAIAEACWREAEKAGIVSADVRPRFDAQICRFLSISWRVTDWEESISYAQSYDRNGRELDAVRQTREFKAWGPGGWDLGLTMNKDSLSGREEMLLGGPEWWARNGDRLRGLWSVLLRRKHEGDLLGAITLIKRTWHRAYLDDAKWGLDPLHTSEASQWKTAFPFPSTFHIAQHDPTKKETDDQREPDEDSDQLSRYFAVVAFDGDQIGKWVGGSFHELDEPFHREFSQRLGNFALHCVRPIVVACDGRLIYAGGDDVLALLPADTALECARLLRMAYYGDLGFIKSMTGLASQLRQGHMGAGKRLPTGDKEEISRLLVAAAGATLFEEIQGRVALKGQGRALDLPGEIAGRDEEGKVIHPDASVGIAVAHFKDPLQDVIREAQAAEKRAKRSPERGGFGRSAVAVTLLKRSGETIEWGCKWDSGGLYLHRAIIRALDAQQLSAKFPHRFAEMLSPYVTDSTPLLRETGAVQPVNGFPVEKIAMREFTHVLSRQCGSDFPKLAKEQESLLTGLTKSLEGYLDHLRGTTPEAIMHALIGLMQTASFTKAPSNDQQTEAQPL